MTELWVLFRWMSEVVVSGDVKNEWLYAIMDFDLDLWDYFLRAGKQIASLFG